jgi:hypothetical protein
VIDNEDLERTVAALDKLPEDLADSLWLLPVEERRSLGRFLSLSPDELAQLKRELVGEQWERWFRMDLGEDGE